ncbi:predicted head to tail connector protein [Citrobacter phage CR8]|uniref:Portal protein n=1 Tax=Citrobacter phage CR8 TaxID=1455076 RepID=W6PND6_9CAUD|nr:head-tail adaptor [Citrobacter phage CR8]CDM21622.1 predicted head to tail connector protein [Citrobacter phage CR8]
MATTKREGFALNGAKVVYEQLTNSRAPYETRAENNASVTIPSLYPKSSDNASTNYETPWQSHGARCLNNLAAKLMLALFPQSPWMRLAIGEFEAKQLSTDAEALAKVDEGLSMVERILMNYIEANSFRVTLFEALKQLVVSGNCLLYIPDPSGSDSSYNPMRMYRLSSYVVQRDAFGNILQMVAMDKVAFSALPEDVQSTLSDDHEPDEELEVYTHIYLQDGEYLRYEEIDGEEIQGTDGTYPIDACPYIPVRMIKLDGEDYGRSYVEEYYGDLKTLETITEAITKMAKISAKVLMLVNPNGITQARRINKAKTGEAVAGRVEDVNFLQLNKQSDFSIAKAVADEVSTRLGYAFLLNSAVQRNAERVTAEEIRYVASELESTLGGVYSVLSQELQLPIVRVLLNVLQAAQKVPDLPKEAVEPTVSTGLEALGRGQDLEKLMQAVRVLADLQQLSQDPDIDMATLKLRLFNGIGIDSAGLMLSQEQKQQRMAEQAAQAATTQGAASMGGAAGEAMAAAGAADVAQG